MRLHVNYLRSLEDSDRTRAACCTYLQNWLIHFYPERPDIVEDLQELARSLGGQLEVTSSALEICVDCATVWLEGSQTGPIRIAAAKDIGAKGLGRCDA